MRCNKKSSSTENIAVELLFTIMTSYSGPYNPTFLHQQIKALLKFYDPICKDEKLGGFFNQLRDDGTVYDSSTKHAVGKVIDTK